MTNRYPSETTLPRSIPVGIAILVVLCHRHHQPTPSRPGSSREVVTVSTIPSDGVSWTACWNTFKTIRPALKSLPLSTAKTASAGRPRNDKQPPEKQATMQKNRHCNSGWLRRLGLVVVLVVALVLAVIVVLVSTNRQKTPKTTPLVEFILDVSYDKSIRYPMTDKNPTPAESALDWLSKNVAIDELYLTAASVEQTSVVQKFVLASLYYQSLSLRFEQDGKWLTATNHSGECGWFYGVVCNDNGVIESLEIPKIIGRGSIPIDLALLTRLGHLALEENELTGTIPTELGRLTHLRALFLRSNLLGGTIPTEIGNLTLIERLDIDNNNIRGTIPSEFRHLAYLDTLFLGNNRLSGVLPTELGLLSRMTTFSAGTNSLVGTVPSEWAAWTDLELLSLYYNKLGGTFPEIFSTSFANLHDLNLENNEFTGPLDNVIGNWTSLKYLEVSSNQFTGTIPTSIVQLESLVSFRARENKLRGSISSEMAQLSALSNIYLPLNELTGNLPSELGLLTSMVTFVVNDNELYGALPTEYGNWIQLEYFEVERNAFSGTIPTEYANWTALLSGRFQENQIDGDMPICTQSPNMTLLIVDCEEVNCECCTVCCDESGRCCGINGGECLPSRQ